MTVASGNTHTYTLDARTVTPHFPGIGRYVRSLAMHLPAHLRDDESLVVITRPGDSESFICETLQPLQVTTVSATASPFSLQQQWAIRLLLRRIRAARGQRLLYHSPYYLMPYLTPCPTVLSLYDSIALTLPDTVSPRARMLFRMTTLLAIKASEHVLVISDTARQDLLAHFAIKPASVTTVHLAADETFRPQPPEEQNRIRNAYGLHTGYLLYLGSNKPHKNLVRLVDAYARFRAQWHDDPVSLPALIIAGAWEEHYPEATQRIAYHRLGESVRILGAVDDADLPALYSAATSFVFPSRYEGFGLPVLEAMSCGTPVACSHISSLPEVAGSAAYYFDPYSVESIAAALNVLISGASLRNHLREMGLRRARRFSWDQTAKQTLDVYRSAIRKGGD